MPLFGCLSLVLLFLAALGATWWWRGPTGTIWYGNAVFYWGVFFLAVYMMWSMLKTLGL